MFYKRLFDLNFQNFWGLGLEPQSRKYHEVCVSLSPMKTLPAIEGIPVTWAEGFTPAISPDIWKYDVKDNYLCGVMPNNAEVLAAFHLHNFRKAGKEDDTEFGKNSVLCLPLFLAAGGDAGPALHLAVLYAMSANDPAARIAGSDGLVQLIDQGRYNNDLACELVSLTVRYGTVKAGRLSRSLSQAAEAGLDAVLWPIIRTAVISALEVGRTPPGTSGLVALAYHVVSNIKVREDIPILGKIAAKKGSNLILEVRRLHTLLTSGV